MHAAGRVFLSRPLTLDFAKGPQSGDVCAVNANRQFRPINCLLIVNRYQIGKTSRITRQEKLNPPVRARNDGFARRRAGDRGERRDGCGRRKGLG